MTEAKILDRTETEKMIDTHIPSFRDRLRLHLHDVKIRQELERLQTLVVEAPVRNDTTAADIAKWIRSLALGREGTVRGQYAVKIAQMIEDGTYKEES